VIPDPTVLGSAMTSDPLTPEGWFMSGHGVHNGVYNVEGQWVPSPSSTTVLLWAPAPAAASIAVDDVEKKAIQGCRPRARTTPRTLFCVARSYA